MMLRRPVLVAIAVGAFALAEGCSSNDVRVPIPSKEVTRDEPCTDPATCCRATDLVCSETDQGVVCSCRMLWSCDKNKNKCQQLIQTPDAQGGWNCTEWNEFRGLKCERPGSEVPEGGGYWTCQADHERNVIVCVEDEISSPTGPDGVADWGCEITDTEGLQKLVCERTTPTPGDSHQVPIANGEWNCNADETECRQSDGLPDGKDWTCHEEIIGGQAHLTCAGRAESSPDGAWSCEKMPNEFDKWICHRLKNDAPDSGNWACVAGSEYGGIVCEKVEHAVEPPGFFSGDPCVPGTLRWCDSLQFSSWGTVACRPDGLWATKVVNGKKMLDCQETGSDRRPNTACGCYHFYFNPKCCERPDCIIPEGTDGQICSSSGGQTCDYCNPLQVAQCKKGICIVSNSMETFCTEHCGPNKSCPRGMFCMAVKSEGRVFNECLPMDFSCYNGL